VSGNVKESSQINNHESINAATLEEIRELTVSPAGAEQFGKLIGLFLKELDSGVASIREAAAEQNSEKLSEVAHRLKGACGSMGASYLVSLCIALEEASAKAQFEKVGAQLKEMESEIIIVGEILEREICGASSRLGRPPRAAAVR
jgi:HPt (histidine-containing phosphotransfer) domain-containing protein